jgi:hypothetical protein
MTRRTVIAVGIGLIVLGLAGALVGAGWPASRSGDDHDAALVVRVTDARRSACRNGAALWTVGVDVIARAEPGSALSGASLTSDYTTSGSRSWRHATVSQTGDTFVPGRLIGPSGVLRAHPGVSVTLPCNASAARLVGAVRVCVDDPEQRAAAAFVANGIAMSPSSVGGFALLLLVALFALRRLSRTRASA